METFNNGLLIQWGEGTYPRVNADSSNEVWVAFPITFYGTYEMFIDYISDAGDTHHLRHTGTYRYPTGATVYWFSTAYTTYGTGFFGWLCVGY